MVEPVQKIPASASARIKQLEKDVAELQRALVEFSKGVNDVFSKQVAPLARRLDDLEEIVAVIIDDYGEEVLQKGLDDRRARKLAEGIAAARANIANGVEKGYLVPAETVTSESLIVGAETGPDGSVVSAFSSFLYRQLTPDAQASLLGKPVGATHQAGPNTFSITEIYNVDVSAAAAVVNEQLKAPEPAKEAA